MRHPQNRAARRSNGHFVVRNRLKKMYWPQAKIDLIKQDDRIDNKQKEYLINCIVGALDKTAVSCSCYMCGNPRRFADGYSRLSMQERRAIEIHKEYDNDWVDDDLFDIYAR